MALHQRQAWWATIRPRRARKTEENAATAAKPNFDKVGPQVGDQLPDLKLRTLKGEPQRLGDAWRGGPALVVTSSFTCPKSRIRWPDVKAIVEKYGEKLNVVIVYVIEAHPVGSVCPYKGVEEITPENQRDGILRHQPKTLEDRLDLAQEFKRYLRVDAPIYVDTINYQAWKAFGAAPIKVLLDAGAKIDAVNVKGLTPLMSAIEPPLYTGINEKSRLKNMELLLSSGADVNARDANGLTVLDHAKSAQNAVVYQVKEDVIDLLRKHGAKTGASKAKK